MGRTIAAPVHHLGSLSDLHGVFLAAKLAVNVHDHLAFSLVRGQFWPCNPSCDTTPTPHCRTGCQFPSASWASASTLANGFFTSTSSLLNTSRQLAGLIRDLTQQSPLFLLIGPVLGTVRQHLGRIRIHVPDRLRLPPGMVPQQLQLVLDLLQPDSQEPDTVLDFGAPDVVVLGRPIGQHRVNLGPVLLPEVSDRLLGYVVLGAEFSWCSISSNRTVKSRIRFSTLVLQMWSYWVVQSASTASTSARYFCPRVSDCLLGYVVLGAEFRVRLAAHSRVPDELLDLPGPEVRGTQCPWHEVSQSIVIDSR